MIRRILAALVAVALAAVAAVLVVNYANAADARALEGMQTDNVYVAIAMIPDGTRADELASLVVTKAVPRQFQVEGRVKDLKDLKGRVAVTTIAAGEQLQLGRFATPEELRTRGEFTIPDEARDLHQVTIPLENPRALGGSIAPGDRVGVFGSFEIETDHKYVLDDDGDIVFDPSATQSQDSASGSDQSEGSSEDEDESFNITDLLLHKVLVIRVEGGYVAPPPALSEDDGGEEGQSQVPADTIHVTLALPAEDAARVVYAQEFGTVWLSLEPESADDEEIPTIVITVPSTGRNVLE